MVRVLLIEAPFTLYCGHTWLNRVTFRCGLGTRLTYPWRCYCSADLLGFFAFICRPQPCIRKNMLNIIWENPYFDHTVLITAMFVACLCFTWCCKYFDFIYFVPISIKDGLSCVSHRSTVYVVDSSPFHFIIWLSYLEQWGHNPQTTYFPQKQGKRQKCSSGIQLLNSCARDTNTYFIQIGFSKWLLDHYSTRLILIRGSCNILSLSYQH